jgi:hypothetical protein
MRDAPVAASRGEIRRVRPKARRDIDDERRTARAGPGDPERVASRLRAALSRTYASCSDPALLSHTLSKALCAPRLPPNLLNPIGLARSFSLSSVLFARSAPRARPLPPPVRASTAPRISRVVTRVTLLASGKQLVMPKASKGAYYAVRVGRVPGVYTTWSVTMLSVASHI